MTPSEHSEVQFGRTLIEYGIRRSARRKTVAVTVFPTGDIVLTAPKTATVQRLDRLVHQKARWIGAQLRQIRPAAQSTPEKEFISGETFLYLGRQYRLRVGAGPEGVTIEGGKLVVQIAKRHAGPENIRGLLIDWYRERAEDKLAKRVEVWAKRLDMPPPKVLVREQELRWGSCSATGVVRFNWRIVQASPRLIDYVVAHELVHLRHPNHTKAFWAALGSVLPDVDARRAALREFGGRVDW